MELGPVADTILPVMVDIARLGEQEWDVYRDVRLASLEEAPSAFGSRLAAERDRTEAEWRDRLEHRTQFVAREECLDRRHPSRRCLPAIIDLGRRDDKASRHGRPLSIEEGDFEVRPACCWPDRDSDTRLH